MKIFQIFLALPRLAWWNHQGKTFLIIYKLFKNKMKILLKFVKLCRLAWWNHQGKTLIKIFKLLKGGTNIINNYTVFNKFFNVYLWKI